MNPVSLVCGWANMRRAQCHTPGARQSQAWEVVSWLLAIPRTMRGSGTHQDEKALMGGCAHWLLSTTGPSRDLGAGWAWGGCYLKAAPHSVGESFSNRSGSPGPWLFQVVEGAGKTLTLLRGHGKNCSLGALQVLMRGMLVVLVLGTPIPGCSVSPSPAPYSLPTSASPI